MINRHWLQTLPVSHHRVKVLISAVFIVFGLSACVTSSSPPGGMQEQFVPVSAVSVAQTGFAVRPGDKYAWRTEMLWIGEDAEGPYRQALTGLHIDRELDRQLSERGLQRVDIADADYVLIAAVRLGEDTEGVAVKELARLYPSLHGVSLTLEKGTLLVAMSHPGSPVIMWRGAIETFISADIAAERRQDRLRAVVQSLLKTLPSSGASE